MRPSTPCVRWRSGIYPPLLEEQGIAPRSPRSTRVARCRCGWRPTGSAATRSRLEAAVYFCTLEALQNAAKYARASEITIAFRERNGALEFSVTDDGVGFLADDHHRGTGIQGMRDRMAVLGGDAEIDSTPGEGTTVRGRIPIAQAVPA